MKKLVFVTVFLLLAVHLTVAAAAVVDSGKCGDNLTWTLSDDGLLEISGTGAMWDYNIYDNLAPWSMYSSGLKSLKLNEGITTIGDCAFNGCSGFTGSLTIPDSVTTIGLYAFWRCSGFTGSLKIPDSVTTIGNSAFGCCSGFTGGLTIPDNATTIEAMAFVGCSGFTGSLAIGKNVMTIGYGAFDSCSGFTGRLRIPDSVTTIGSSAFCDCSGFTGILTIPASVETIWMNAFDGCAGITAAKFVGNAPTVGDSIFGTRGDDFAIYYQSGKSGWTTPTWNGYKTAVYDPTQEISLSSQSDYSIKNGKIDGERIIAGASEKTDCKTFLSNFENTNLVLCNAEGETLNEDYAGYVGTGFKLKALVESGAVIDEVTVIINGEISGDGDINATDRMILARYLAKWDGYEEKIKSTEAADIDGDGDITAKDRMILARYLAGWIGYDQYFTVTEK